MGGALINTIGTNGCTRTVETTVNPAFTYPALVARAASSMAAAMGISPVRALLMTVAFFDLKAAFKTVPTSQPCLAAIAVWDEAAKDVRYYYHPGHPFGLTASVINFAQLPEMISAAARTFCGLPVDHYVDDYMLPDLAAGGHSGQYCLEAIHDAMGDGGRWPPGQPRRAPHLDPNKTKVAATRNEGLGVIIDLGTLPGQRAVTFTPKPSRVRKILEQWRSGRRRGAVSGSECAKLQGRCNFLLDTAYGRVGRAALLPLIDCQRTGGAVFGEAMGRAHDFFEALLAGEPRGLPPLRVPIMADPTPPVLLYTDASFSWRRKRQGECSARTSERHYLHRTDPVLEPWRFDGHLGVVLHDPLTGAMRAADGTLDDATIRYFMRHERRTYIAQLEAVAALSALLTYPEMLAGRRVVHFVDNTVALSAIVHGYARKPDMAALSNAYTLYAAGLRAQTYLDYVASKANIADLPSRRSFAMPRALGAEVHVGGMVVPTGGMLERPLERWLRDGQQHGAGKQWPA